MARGGAVVGIADHAGWAVAVTVDAGGTLLERRRAELIDPGLPCLPHHHEAQSLPLDEAEALIERVRASASANAKTSLDAIAAAVSEPIVAVALRACPALPPSVAERISDYRAQCVADTVMYREALALAASTNSWPVHWYDAKHVSIEAAAAMNVDEHEFAAHLKDVGASLGPPWRKDHGMAVAAAIVTLERVGRLDLAEP